MLFGSARPPVAAPAVCEPEVDWQVCSNNILTERLKRHGNHETQCLLNRNQNGRTTTTILKQPRSDLHGYEKAHPDPFVRPEGTNEGVLLAPVERERNLLLRRLHRLKFRTFFLSHRCWMLCKHRMVQTHSTIALNLSWPNIRALSLMPNTILPNKPHCTRPSFSSYDGR